MEEVVKKEMTLDELAAMVADGFADIAGRMATKDDIAVLRQEMQNGFKAVDDRFAEQTIKIDFIRTELADVKRELAELSKRVKEDNNALSGEVVKLKARIDVLETKLKLLESKVV